MRPTLIIQNCEIESPGTIIDYLKEKEIPYQIFHSYQDKQFPEHEQFEAVINLGCPCSVTEYSKHEYLIKLFEYVTKLVKTDKPYLGICFGGQILAKALGADVKANPVKEIGTYQVELTDLGLKDKIFKDFNSKFDVFHWHGDTFGIPENAQLLATGVDCLNQAFRYKNMVAIQFHLEADIREIPRWCNDYDYELEEISKSREEIINDYIKDYNQIKKLNYKFLDNFYNDIK